MVKKIQLVKSIDLSWLAKATVTPIRVKRIKHPKYYKKQMRKYRNGNKI